MKHQITVTAALFLSLGCASEWDNRYEDGSEIAEWLADLPVTAPETLPDNVSARYDGYAGMLISTAPGIHGGYDIIGLATIDVDFAAGDVSGRFYDFTGNYSGPVEGELALSDGIIDTTDSSFAGTVSGALTIKDRTGTIDDPFTGEFRGDAAIGLVGYGEGKASFDSGYEGDYLIDVVAKR